MKRASQERLHALLLHRKYWQWQRPREKAWAQGLPVNQFRKTLRIGGCCNTRCYLCHAEKLFGFSTLWELKARDKEKDGIAELFESPPPGVTPCISPSEPPGRKKRRKEIQ